MKKVVDKSVLEGAMGELPPPHHRGWHGHPGLLWAMSFGTSSFWTSSSWRISFMLAFKNVIGFYPHFGSISWRALVLNLFITPMASAIRQHIKRLDTYVTFDNKICLLMLRPVDLLQHLFGHIVRCKVSNANLQKRLDAILSFLIFLKKISST